MNKRAVRADILLLLTAGIWGFGFVAQRSGMQYVGPFTYNAIRFILGSVSLIPLILYFKNRRAKHPENSEHPENPENTGAKNPAGTAFFSTFLAGSLLFIAVVLQQLGIMFTTVGNAGFITGLYVVLTPIFGIALGKKTGVPTWIGALFTLGGLYFLSAAGRMNRINPGDLLTIISAVFWSFHVLLIDRLVQKTDPLILSSGQFAWCGLYTLAAALLFEPAVPSWASFIAPGFPLQAWHSLSEFAAALSGRITLEGFSLASALVPILYGSLASVGIAYTLQVVAQKDAPPAHATIILCLEGCFAALGGVIILGEPLGPWTILGFMLMLLGMLITQWEVIRGSGQ
ncbi:MAG: DMT family transporter [Spirochaetaceae bacterium]|jgi:drug/metabolite transporter (DMT)-like permease|nr:DMT family transporter [Spirochaetaceae bacterium]